MDTWIVGYIKLFSIRDVSTLLDSWILGWLHISTFLVSVYLASQKRLDITSYLIIVLRGMNFWSVVKVLHFSPYIFTMKFWTLLDHFVKRATVRDYVVFTFEWPTWYSNPEWTLFKSSTWSNRYWKTWRSKNNFPFRPLSCSLTECLSWKKTVHIARSWNRGMQLLLYSALTFSDQPWMKSLQDKFWSVH